MDKLLTTAEMASVIRCHRVTLGRWTRNGDIPSIRIGKRGDYRYDPQAVIAALAAMATESDDGRGRPIGGNKRNFDNSPVGREVNR